MGHVSLAPTDETLRTIAGARSDTFAPEDFTIDGNQARVSEEAQREELRERAKEEYGEDAEVSIGSMRGELFAEVDPPEPDSVTSQLETRAERRYEYETTQLRRGATSFEEGAGRAFNIATNPRERLEFDPGVSGGPGTGDYLDVDLVDVQPEPEGTETQDRQVSQRNPVGVVAAPAIVGVTLAGGAAAASSGYNRPGMDTSVFIESEIDPAEELFVGSEVPVQDPGIESEVQPEEAVPDISEVDPQETEFPNEVGTDVGVTPTEVGIPGIDGGQSVGDGGQTDDSVVSGDYPSPGIDFPADPRRDYVGGETDLTADLAPIGQQIGEIGEQVDREDSIFGQRQTRFDREREEILQGPGEDVVLGEQRRNRLFEEPQERYVFPGSPTEAEATEPELDVVQEPQMDVAQQPGQGQMNDLFPAVDARQDTQVGQQAAQAQQMDELFDFGQAYETQQAQEQAYPTETTQAYEYPPEFGYGYGTGEGGRTGRTPPRPPFPDFGGDDDGDTFGSLFGASEQVEAEFRDPLFGGGGGSGGDSGPFPWL